MHGSRGAPRRQALSVGARPADRRGDQRPVGESVAPAAIEVALAVQEEIAHRIEQAESFRPRAAGAGVL